MDSPFFQKLGIPLTLDRFFDTSSPILYDKGENIYIPLESHLHLDGLEIRRGEAFSQFGNPEPQFLKLQKEIHSQAVMQIKVKQFAKQLTKELACEFQHLYQITQNKELHSYRRFPILLFPWLKRVDLWPNQEINAPDSFVYVAVGIIRQKTARIQSSFLGAGVAETEATVYVLPKSNIKFLPLFGLLQVQIQPNNQHQLALKNGVVSMEQNSYPQTTVIKDLVRIREMIHQTDFCQLQKKMQEVFGKRKLQQQQQGIQAKLHQPSIKIAQTRTRTQTPQSVKHQKMEVSLEYRPKFKKVFVRRGVQKIIEETSNYCDVELFNKATTVKHQKRRALSFSKQKTQVSGSSPMRACLPIIKSYIEGQEDLGEQLQRQKTSPSRNRHKFLEYQKLLDSQLKHLYVEQQ